MQLNDWLRDNKSIFSESDARFLIESLLGSQMAFLLSEGVSLGRDEIDYLEQVKETHRAGVPLAYILGKEAFFGREFEVDRNCLIPRKETELVAEAAIKLINLKKLKSVLDLCCGCGNIAISLKKQVEDISVSACDISRPALEVCHRNINRHEADIELIHSDLFSGLKGRAFDLIVSNPPYVESENIKGALSFEPKEALWASSDGLYYIREIIRQAKSYLSKKGYLILEIGAGQKQSLEELAVNNFYEIVEWVRDYSGHHRAIVLQL